jgi:hypothetical protein
MAKAPADIRSLARAHTETAVRTLASIMNDSDAPHAARVSAASVLIDRGWGKPTQPIEMKADPLDGMSTDELRDFLTAIRSGIEAGADSEDRSNAGATATLN